MVNKLVMQAVYKFRVKLRQRCAYEKWLELDFIQREREEETNIYKYKPSVYRITISVRLHPKQDFD